MQTNVPAVAVELPIANILAPASVSGVLAVFCLPAFTRVSAVTGVPAIADLSNIPGSAGVASFLLWKGPCCFRCIFCHWILYTVKNPAFLTSLLLLASPLAVADTVASVAGTPAGDCCASGDDGGPDVVGVPAIV